MTLKDKSVPVEPSLVAWVLYDATADKKYIKMDPTNGSLAIFDSEEAAMSAKRAHPGTDYDRCEYYSAPQPTPEVAKLVEALEYLMEKYPASRHLQDTCSATLAAYRNQQPSSKCPGAGCTDQGCPAHYVNDCQPALVEALEGLLAIVADSSGVAGYHMNGDIAEWDELVEVFLAEEALELYRKQGGDV